MFSISSQDKQLLFTGTEKARQRNKNKDVFQETQIRISQEKLTCFKKVSPEEGCDSLAL